MARGALLGARGNSGVIVSQILRGFADALAAAPAVAGGRWPPALRAATAAAYTAVARPVEGTVLTVVAAAAAAAEQAGRVRRPAGGGPGRGPARRPRRWPVPPSSCRCWPAPAWSTPAAAGSVVLLDALVEVLTGERVDASRRPRPRRPPGDRGRPRDRLRRVRLRGAVPARRRRAEAVGAAARRARRRWATRWSSSATASRPPGTSTCTSTTSARRSRPAWPPAGRTRSR